MTIRRRTSYGAPESYKHLTNDNDIVPSQADSDQLEEAEEKSTPEKSEFFVRPKTESSKNRPRLRSSGLAADRVGLACECELEPAQIDNQEPARQWKR